MSLVSDEFGLLFAGSDIKLSDEVTFLNCWPDEPTERERAAIGETGLEQLR